MVSWLLVGCLEPLIILNDGLEGGGEYFKLCVNGPVPVRVTFRDKINLPINS